MSVRTEVPWRGDTVPEQAGSASPRPVAVAEAPACEPDPFIGRVIDERYRIIEKLGEGGMGSVYIAEHLKLRKQVAVKTILAEFASNPQIEARFAREALATAQLDHPHVASALDFGHFPDGGAYLVIQLVRGVTLARHLEARGQLPWGLVVELGAQIADALAAAHAAGVVHRDLKPDNILLEPRDDGRFHAKVVDFGIARVSSDAPSAPARGAQLTRIGAILGTPGYMAPEQAVGQPVDARGDLYALGVILWECCIGRRLWQGESINELVACQLRSTPPTLQDELGSRVPEALSQLVAQLLSNAPSKRPDAAAPIRDELRQLVALAAPASAHATHVGRALPAALVPAPPAWSLAALRQRLAGRGGLVAAGGGVAAVVVLVALIGRCGASPGAPVSLPATTAASQTLAPAASTVAVAAAASAPLAAAPAAVAAPEPEPSPTVLAADDPPLPAALTDAAAALLGTKASARKRAAKQVRAHEPAEAVPLYLRDLAALEVASSCTARRGVLEQMDAAADARVLPALHRLSSTRRRGCGFFKSQDCLECLRETLARVIGRLEGAN